MCVVLFHAPEHVLSVVGMEVTLMIRTKFGDAGYPAWECCWILVDDMLEPLGFWEKLSDRDRWRNTEYSCSSNDGNCFQCPYSMKSITERCSR
jgi:hypothetical protein